MTDTELDKALKECIAKRRPLDAALLFDEAIRRARATNNAEQQCRLIMQRIVMDSERNESYDFVSKAFAQQIDKAERPLRNMLALAAAENVDVWRDRNAKMNFVMQALDDDGTLCRLKPQDIGYEDVPQEQASAYTCIAAKAASELYNCAGYSYPIWRKNTQNADNKAVCEDSILARWQSVIDAHGKEMDHILYDAYHMGKVLQREEMKGADSIVVHMRSIAQSDEAMRMVNYAEMYIDIQKAEKENDTEKSDTMARSVVERYKKYKTPSFFGLLMPKADKSLKEIEKRELSFRAEDVIGVGQSIPMTIYYRNMSEAELRIYALPAAKPKTRIDIAKELPKLKPLRTTLISLPKVRRMIEACTAHYEADGLERGYYIVALFDGNKLKDTEVIKVSNLRTMEIADGQAKYYAAFDALTGEPLTNTSVGGRKVDAMGVARVTTKHDVMKITNGRDVIEMGVYMSANAKPKPMSRAWVLTDRNIYRPEQTLHFEVVAYEATLEGRHVLPGTKLNVNLSAYNGQKLAQLDLMTNDYGSAASHIDIPADAPLGLARLTITDDKQRTLASANVSIEEYKRKNNTLTFLPMTDMYVLGDTIRVQAKATNAAGIPMSGLEVKYSVDDGIGVLKEGEATTDADGIIEVCFETNKPSAKKTYNWTYGVELELIDHNGENTKASKNVEISPRGFMVSADNLPDFATNAVPSLKLNCKTEYGAAVRTHVHAAVIRLDATKMLLPDAPSFNRTQVDTIIGDRLSFDINGRYSSDMEREVVVESDFDVEGETICQIPFDSLTVGQYRLRISGTYANGEKYTIDRDFCVYPSVDGVVSNVGKLIVSTPSKVCEGEELKVRIATGYRDQVVTAVMSCGGQTTIKQVRLNSEIKTVSMIVPKDIHSSNVSVNIYLGHDNRCVMLQTDIPITIVEPCASLELVTHRDVSTPGAKEHWTLRTDANELTASMYDARLDKFVSNKWNTYVASLTTNSHVGLEYIAKRAENHDAINQWNMWAMANGFVVDMSRYGNELFRIHRDKDIIAQNESVIMRGTGGVSNRKMMSSLAMQQPALLYESVSVEEDSFAATDAIGETEENGQEDQPQPRIDFRETVFFFPQLRPNSAGIVELDFDLPDNITSYVFRAVAHKADMAHAACEAKLAVRKLLFVEAGWPRFLRQGDRVEVVATVTATDDDIDSAECMLTVSDAVLGKPIAEYPVRQVAFATGKQQRVKWTVCVPDNISELKVETKAVAKGHTDIEVRQLPVEPKSVEVAESKTFVLLNAGDHNVDNPYSSDANTRQLSFRYTANTLMEVLRALPSLNDGWSEGSDTYVGRIESSCIALMLAQNPDLHEAASHLNDMHEPIVDADNTPWRELAIELRKHDGEVADMLLTDKPKKTLSESIKKLLKLRGSNGGYRWFDGMEESPYLTAYILGKMGELSRLGALADNVFIDELNVSNLYLQLHLTKIYNDHKDKKKADFGLWYADELLAIVMTSKDGVINNTIKAMIDDAAAKWTKANTYTSITIARLMQAVGRADVAREIAETLRQNLVRTDSYAHVSERSVAGWYRPLKANAELIMLFGSLGMADDEVKMITNWLVMQKRGDYWPDREATSRAVLALLGTGKRLSHTDVVALDGERYELTTSHPQVVVPVSDLNTPKATITKIGDMPSWGAWTRINASPIAELRASGCKELSIERTVSVVRDKDSEPVGPSTHLNVGDHVVVSLHLKANTNLSFVEVTDYRPASFEPVDFLSGYRGFCWWRGGVPHYFSPSDKRVSFFVYDLMRNHDYTFEYEATVTNEGVLSGGYAEARCLFAPEVVAHSAGMGIN